MKAQKNIRSQIALLSILPLMVNSVSSAEEPKNALDFSASLGLEHDDSIGVVELDIYTEEADSARSLAFGVKAKGGQNRAWKLDGSYDFSGKYYQQYDEYDLSIHRVGAGTTYSYGKLDTRVGFDYALANLGGSKFLELKQASVAFSGFVGDGRYLRIAPAIKKKSFPGRAERNADQLALNADYYAFFNKAKTHWVIGGLLSQENASGSALDYQERGLKLSFNHKFSFVGLDHKVSLTSRLSWRDYDVSTDSIENDASENTEEDILSDVGGSENTHQDEAQYSDRQDKRTSLGLKLTTTVNDRFSLVSSWVNTNNDSSDDTAAYDENVIALSVKYLW